MSLRLKIHLIVGVLTLLFVSAVLALQLRSMRESVREEVVAANRVAAQLLNRTVWRYAAHGTSAILGFLQGMERIRSNDVTLLDSEGRTLYQSPPSPYKAGREAPAWFAALVSPTPAQQAIEFPDGKLVVQANASRAVLDVWDEAVVLVSSALALLVLLNVLVYWLVGRTVRPFRQIVGALNQLEAGRFDVALPPLPGSEAATIGVAFNRMVGMLQNHVETERRAVRAELQLSESRELTRWVDHHIEQERRLIARELHDELGQSVTAMRSMALSIAQRVGAVDPQAEQAARTIADESSRLYDAMHGIIPRLTPLLLDSFGLADAQLGSDAALALYRAAQEGITNALNHGHARQLSLRVQGSAREVLLQLGDDGVGLPPDWAHKPGHHGLRWLGERVQGLGGQFELTAVEPQGTLLTLRLPLPAATETTTEDSE